MTRNLTAAVGTRFGVTAMPNRSPDLAVLTELFDAIPIEKGGCAEIGGLWASERRALIAELTAQIVVFQTLHGRPVIDGVVDPKGGTLRLLNELAAAKGPPAPDEVRAQVTPVGHDILMDLVDVKQTVADPGSLPGRQPLRPLTLPLSYRRRLVSVTGSSVKWFGVVVPEALVADTVGAIAHINFTPTPIQGHYQEATYDSFAGWIGLWRDYTTNIGRQLVLSGARQILVLPFYRTSQMGKLGAFLANWQVVVESVVTAALASMQPGQTTSQFTVDRIVSSSFSNGWLTHQDFYSNAVGARDRTSVCFDLDGAAAKPPSVPWRPGVGVTYINQPAPPAGNPIGNVWYVGERWAKFHAMHGGPPYTHQWCRDHLLYHGLWQYCT